MTKESNHDWSAYVGIVENNIGEFVEEMRTIDIVDLITFVRTERFPNIEDLVNSSTELFFKSEMLVFTWAAGIDLRWESRPVVTLGMEFRHPTVSLFFNLSIGATERAVEMLGVVFEEARLDPIAQVRRAFRDARLVDGARNPVVVRTRAGRGTAGPSGRE